MNFSIGEEFEIAQNEGNIDGTYLTMIARIENNCIFTSENKGYIYSMEKRESKVITPFPLSTISISSDDMFMALRKDRRLISIIKIANYDQQIKLTEFIIEDSLKTIDVHSARLYVFTNKKISSINLSDTTEVAKCQISLKDGNSVARLGNGIFAVIDPYLNTIKVLRLLQSNDLLSPEYLFMIENENVRKLADKLIIQSSINKVGSGDLQIIYLYGNELRLMEINIDTQSFTDYILPNMSISCDFYKNFLLLSRLSDYDPEELESEIELVVFDLKLKKSSLLKQLKYSGVAKNFRFKDLANNEGLVFRLNLPLLIFQEYADCILKSSFQMISLDTQSLRSTILISQSFARNLDRFLSEGINNEEIEEQLIDSRKDSKVNEVLETFEKEIARICKIDKDRFMIVLELLQPINKNEDKMIINRLQLMLEDLLEALLNNLNISDRGIKVYRVCQFETKGYSYNLEVIKKIKELDVDLSAIELGPIIYGDYVDLLEYSFWSNKRALAEYILSSLVSPSNYISIYKVYLDNLKQEFIDDEFYSKWIANLFSKKEEFLMNDFEPLKNLYFDIILDVIYSMSLDLYGQLLFYPIFWEQFEHLSNHQKATSCFIKLRIDYFLIDRTLRAPGSLDKYNDITECRIYFEKAIKNTILESETPSETLLELEGEIRFLADSSDDILEIFKEDFTVFISSFLEYKKNIIQKALQENDFDLLSTFNIEELGINIDVLEDMILLNLTPYNYESISRVCKRTRYLKNCQMICDVIMVFKKIGIDAPLQRFADIDEVERLFTKAISNIIQSKPTEQSIYYMNVAYSLKVSELENVAKLLGKMLIDIYALRLYLSEYGPYTSEYCLGTSIEKEIELTSLIIEELIREDKAELVETVLATNQEFSIHRIENIIFEHEISSILGKKVRSGLGLNISMNFFKKAQSKTLTYNNYPWIWWQSSRAEGLSSLAIVSKIFSELELPLSISAILHDEFPIKSIQRIWEERRDSSMDLRLVSVYPNAMKFQRLYVHFNEEKLNFGVEGSINEQNLKFEEYNRSRLLKYSSIDPFKVDEFIGFLTKQMCPDLVKLKYNDELKETLIALASHNRRSDIVDIVSTIAKDEQILSSFSNNDWIKICGDEFQGDSKMIVDNFLLSFGNSADIAQIYNHEDSQSNPKLLIKQMIPDMLEIMINDKKYLKHVPETVFKQVIIEGIEKIMEDDCSLSFLVVFLRYLPIDQKRSFILLSQNLRVIKHQVIWKSLKLLIEEVDLISIFQRRFFEELFDIYKVYSPFCSSLTLEEYSTGTDDAILKEQRLFPLSASVSIDEIDSNVTLKNLLYYPQTALDLQSDTKSHLLNSSFASKPAILMSFLLHYSLAPCSLLTLSSASELLLPAELAFDDCAAVQSRLCGHLRTPCSLYRLSQLLRSPCPPSLALCLLCPKLPYPLNLYFEADKDTLEKTLEVITRDGNDGVRVAAAMKDVQWWEVGY